MFYKSHSLILSILISIFQMVQANLMPKGYSLQVSMDADTKRLKFEIEAPKDTYLGIAYGEGMTATDIVLFQAQGKGKVQDMWTPLYYPYSDSEYEQPNNYEDTSVEVSGEKYSFTTYRKLETDDEYDFQFNECSEKRYQFSWVVNENAPNFDNILTAKHTADGDFFLTFDKTCETVKQEGNGNKLQIVSVVSFMASMVMFYI